MTFRFQVCFEPEEDGGYHAYVPALPGCHSYGRTIEEAERNIKEAILLYLDGLKKTWSALSVATKSESLT
jgi:predicted RNase H-like HicB family nuclease